MNEVVQPESEAITNPGEGKTPEELYQELLSCVKERHPNADLSMIEKAYELAASSHGDQKRKSGEPYIIHPLCVAIILAELDLDVETIAAGLLHDVVEDTDKTVDDIKEEFGEEVALLVDGVTKLGQINYSTDKTEVQGENLRKMFLAMAKDIRVILIKLADRLHNMRTLQYMIPRKQQEKARETMDIYAPLAARLGISKLKVELDDLAFRYLHPETYKNLADSLVNTRKQRDDFIGYIVEEVKKHIADAHIKAEIYGRVKHMFSIYKKMVNLDKPLEQIYDLFAVRIIVDTVQDCYACLGVIHEMYTPIPGRFKDYIAMPKPNRYQSLHTTLIGPGGQPFEIQIRTYDMHRIAEYGIAAHWRYKRASDGKKVSKDNEEDKLNWLRQILEWQSEMSDNKEFMSLLKSDLDLFADHVYVFTPEGDVKTLPTGSCSIDFAYAVHSAVGNKMVGARVNGKLVPIEQELKNGDRIEIVTSQNSKGPSRDWLKVVKSTQARNKINQWFKQEFKEENIEKGKALIAAYAKQKSHNLPDLLKPEYLEEVTRKYGFRDWDSVLAAIGHGGVKEGQIVNKLVDFYVKDHKKQVTEEDILQETANNKSKLAITKKHSKGGITVKGANDVSVRFSRCCSPLPGDEIVGYITRGRGVSIHRSDCINVISMSEEDRARLVEAEWSMPDGEVSKTLYDVELRIYASNRTGLVVDVSRILTERKIDILSMNVRTSKQGIVSMELAFSVHSMEELNTLIREIKKISNVLDVERKVG
ncbi:MAG: bifunctional (p)ppGpp synthetase/guanosine-3',5'-bis(diphosphate) 3'-pyrophosphohydrolase [Lachnospiraceae bacterium]|nr:bifunctional (p)ppGpp synthetase/guanosine-3',5'-bis(diphosphate) 3'-pyrophosphohydrolase [Candidatus Equihabitans merdae]